uniref:Uncharacterized protein n=1 Tax=Rhizophora mucronata TaxID=61149 RepID=A0A2P2PVS9_RHIMU
MSFCFSFFGFLL